MKNFFNKVKTNKKARNPLLACCGWSVIAIGFTTLCTWIGYLIGGKLGESLVDFWFDE